MPGPPTAPDRAGPSDAIGQASERRASSERSGRRAELPPGLPDGLVALAAARWRRAEASTAARTDASGLVVPSLDDGRLEALLVDELTAPLRLEAWPPPTLPTPVGDGWINDEVIDDDRDVLDALLADRGEAGPEAVAAAAQELRLPITPYRRPTGAATADVGSPTDGPGPDPASEVRPRPDDPPAHDRRRSDPVGPTEGSRNHRPVVVDLTSHWAGPLATALLARSGAEVIKVDPDCRPDGFRRRPRLYAHLNGNKEIVDLDLRVEDDRRRFERLLGGADLLIESFSRRVMPNLGYDPDRLAELRPGLGLIQIRAFAADSPERHWLAYGPGVHAASGLAFAADPTGAPRPAPVAYADLVAAITAFAAATELLADRSTPGHGAPRHHPSGPIRPIEISLAGSIAPLVDIAGRRRAGADAEPATGAPIGAGTEDDRG